MSLATHLTFALSPDALEHLRSYTRTLAGGDSRREGENAVLAVSYGKARLVLLRTLVFRDLSDGRTRSRMEYLTLVGRVGLADGKKVSLADGLDVTWTGRSLRTLGLVLAALTPSLRAEGGATGSAVLTLDVWCGKDLGDRDTDAVTISVGGGLTEDLAKGGGYSLEESRRVTWQREGFSDGERSRYEVYENGDLLRELSLERKEDRPAVAAVWEPSFVKHLPPDVQAEVREFIADSPVRCSAKNSSNGLPCAVPATHVSSDSGRPYCTGHAPLPGTGGWRAGDRLLPIG